MRPAVIALIAAPILNLARGMVWWKIALAAIAAVIVWQVGVSPVWFIIAGAAAGIPPCTARQTRHGRERKGGNAMIYLQLLLSYLKIGFFGFGGGCHALAHPERNRGTARMAHSEQLTDIIAISQVTPGPIAINSATYVGYAVTGTVWGAALATLAACIRRLP